MTNTWQGDALIDGTTFGTVLRLDAPISFWGGVNPKTSEITLAGHPQLGQKIEGTILVIPKLIGSSSSSAVMLELLHQNIAPCALILGERDAILPIGVLVAKQMSWKTCPVIILASPPFNTGDELSISSGGQISGEAR